MTIFYHIGCLSCKRLPSDHLSTGCGPTGVGPDRESRGQNVRCSVFVCVLCVATGHTEKGRLALPVFFAGVPALAAHLFAHLAAHLAGVSRVHPDNLAAAPNCLVFQLAAKLTPGSVQDAAVQAGLLAHASPRRLNRSSGAGRHVLDLKAFQRDHRVAIGQLRCQLVQPEKRRRACSCSGLQRSWN